MSSAPSSDAAAVELASRLGAAAQQQLLRDVTPMAPVRLLPSLLGSPSAIKSPKLGVPYSPSHIVSPSDHRPVINDGSLTDFTPATFDGDNTTFTFSKEPAAQKYTTLPSDDEANNNHHILRNASLLSTATQSMTEKDKEQVDSAAVVLTQSSSVSDSASSTAPSSTEQPPIDTMGSYPPLLLNRPMSFRRTNSSLNRTMQKQPSMLMKSPRDAPPPPPAAPVSHSMLSSWVLHPDHVFHRWWLMICIVVIFANAWSVPFRLSIGYNRIKGQFTAWNGTDILFDLIYISNILLKTRIAFYQEGALITNPRLIWQNYVRREFLIDIISILPIDWILIIAQEFIAAVFTRLMRLIQLFVVAKYLSDLEASPGVNVTVVRLTKVFFVYILLAHLTGCAWFSFALPNNFGAHEWLPAADIPDMPYMAQYLRAFYWGLAMLSDRVEHPNPYSASTAGFILLTQITGVLLMAYIIGNIAFAIDDANETFQRFRLQLDYVTRFMTHVKLPPDMTDRVIRYYNYMWNLNRGFDDFAVLKDLPSTLRTDVCLQLTESTIGSNPLFQDLDVHFLHALVKVLLQRTLVPDEYVIREGETGDEMYFIRSGVIVITVLESAPTLPSGTPRGLNLISEGHPVSTPSNASTNNLKTPSNQRRSSIMLGAVPQKKVARQVQTCVDGDLLGEFSVLLENCPLRTSSAMAVTYCDLFVLVKDDLANLLSFYPQVQAELEARTAKRRQITIKKEQNILGLAHAAGAREKENSKSGNGRSNGASNHKDAKAEKMKQLLGSTGSTVGESQQAEVDLNGPPVIKVNGKALNPETVQYKILLWLRTYWLSNSHVYQHWCRFIFAISLYNALIIPFRLSFAFDAHPPALLFFDYLLDLFLIINVFVHMWLRHPPRLNNHLLTSSTGRVFSENFNAQSTGTYEEFSTTRWRYLRSGWMVWDILTAFPFDFIMLKSGNMNPWFRVGKWARFFTDLRVLSVTHLQTAGLNVSAVGLMQLGTGFLVLTHWASCAYWSFGYFVGFSEVPAEGASHEEWLPNESFVLQGKVASYLISQFQSFVLLTGFGQKIPPTGDAEIIFVILMIILGILLVAWAIGEVGELIGNLDRFNAEFSRQMLNTTKFMEYRHFDAGIQKRVREYLSHWWSTRRGVDPHVAMEGLPNGLKTEIMAFLCEALLMKVPLFQTLLEEDPSFGRHLIERLTFESYPAMEYVFQAGEIGESMFFITEGEVGIIIPEAPKAGHKHNLHARAHHDHEMHKAPAKIVGQGSFFGEVAILTNGLRTASVRALKPTFLLVLSRQSLWEIMEAHPGFAEHMREISGQRAAKMAYLRAKAADMTIRMPHANTGASGTFGEVNYGNEISRSQGHHHVHGPFHAQLEAHLEEQRQLADARQAEMEEAEEEEGETALTSADRERATARARQQQEEAAAALQRRRSRTRGDGNSSSSDSDDDRELEYRRAAQAEANLNAAAAAVLADDADDAVAERTNHTHAALVADTKAASQQLESITIDGYDADSAKHVPLMLRISDNPESPIIPSTLPIPISPLTASDDSAVATNSRRASPGASGHMHRRTRSSAALGVTPLNLTQLTPPRLAGHYASSIDPRQRSPSGPTGMMDYLHQLEEHNSLVFPPALGGALPPAAAPPTSGAPSARLSTRSSAKKLVQDGPSIFGGGASAGTSGSAHALSTPRGPSGVPRASMFVNANSVKTPPGIPTVPSVNSHMLRSRLSASPSTMTSPRPMASDSEELPNLSDPALATPSFSRNNTTGSLPVYGVPQLGFASDLLGRVNSGVASTRVPFSPAPVSSRPLSSASTATPGSGGAGSGANRNTAFNPLVAAQLFGRQDSGLSKPHPLVRQSSVGDTNKQLSPKASHRLRKTASNLSPQPPPMELIEGLEPLSMKRSQTTATEGYEDYNSLPPNFQPTWNWTGSGSAASSSQPPPQLSVFAQARRLHASRAIETALRNGVVQTPQELVQVVTAVEAQLNQERMQREAAQRANATSTNGTRQSPSLQNSNGREDSLPPSQNEGPPIARREISISISRSNRRRSRGSAEDFVTPDEVMMAANSKKAGTNSKRSSFNGVIKIMSDAPVAMFIPANGTGPYAPISSPNEPAAAPSTSSSNAAAAASVSISVMPSASSDDMPPVLTFPDRDDSASDPHTSPVINNTKGVVPNKSAATRVTLHHNRLHSHGLHVSATRDVPRNHHHVNVPPVDVLSPVAETETPAETPAAGMVGGAGRGHFSTKSATQLKLVQLASPRASSDASGPRPTASAIAVTKTPPPILLTPSSTSSTPTKRPATVRRHVQVHRSPNVKLGVSPGNTPVGK